MPRPHPALALSSRRGRSLDDGRRRRHGGLRLRPHRDPARPRTASGVWLASLRAWRESTPASAARHAADHPRRRRFSCLGLRDRGARHVTFDLDARDLWEKSYAELVADRPGQLGNLLARAPSQVLRIALIYALLDRSPTIKEVHLRAALAVWKYIEQSTAIIFQTATGDLLADVLLDLLRDAGSDGLTRTEIRDRFDRNRTGREIDSALKTLADNGLARMEKESTGGRPAERWRTTETTDTTEGAAP